MSSRFASADADVVVTVLTRAFRRGDANADGRVDVADAISLLSYLFQSGRAPPCGDAADANDDGSLDIGDALKALSHLFADGGPLPPPARDCGVDPSPDELECESFAPCDA